MPYCIKCGTELPADVGICYKCGYPVVLNNNQLEEKTTIKDIVKPTKSDVKKYGGVCKKYLPFILALFIICVIGGIYYMNPNTQYNIAEKAFSNESYSRAVKCYKRAGAYKDAPDKLNVAIKALNYAEGLSSFEKKDYESAIEHLIIAEDFSESQKVLKESYYELAKSFEEQGDSVNAAINYANAVDYKDSYDKAMKISADLVKNSDYDNAKSVYEILDENDYVNYCLGVDALKKSNYAFAKNKLSSARNIFDGEEQYKEATYNYAITQVNSKNYEEALEILSEINDYKDANEYRNSISVAYSKSEIDAGNLNNAINIIENVPDTSDYEGVKASDIKMLLEKNKDWAKVCGKWVSTSGKMKATQDGSYSSYWWYHDFEEGDLTLDIKCSLKGDGSVTVIMKGSVPIYTEYSIVGDLVEQDTYSLTKNINVMKQGTIELDNNASITVAPSRITFNYKKVDKSQDVFFKYIYTTDITFGKLVETF